MFTQMIHNVKGLVLGEIRACTTSGFVRDVKFHAGETLVELSLFGDKKEDLEITITSEQKI